MSLKKSLSRFGLVALLAGTGFIATPQNARAADIYIETVENNGDDSNDGLSSSTPLASVDEARLKIGQLYGNSIIHLGSGVFNEGVLRFNNFSVDIIGEGSDSSIPDQYTELNATFTAGADMTFSNLASKGINYSNGLFVNFKAGGSLSNCVLSERGAVQVETNGGEVDITGCTFRNMSSGTPAIYVEATGGKSEISQPFNISSCQFEDCSPVFEVGYNVSEINAGLFNQYLGCNPLAEGLGSDAFIDFSGSYVEGSEKSTGSTVGCGADLGITELSQLEGFVTNLSNVTFGGNARFPHYPRWPGDEAGDINNDGIPNSEQYGAFDDLDGDGRVNVEDSDPYCFSSAPPAERLPATSGLSLALGMLGVAAAGAYTLRKKGGDRDYSTKN